MLYADSSKRWRNGLSGALPLSLPIPCWADREGTSGEDGVMTSRVLGKLSACKSKIKR